MTVLHLTADVKDDRQVVLTLPPDVPTGMADFIVTVKPQCTEYPQRRGLPAADVLGIGAGTSSPPDDETVKQWMEEHRTEKYG